MILLLRNCFAGICLLLLGAAMLGYGPGGTIVLASGAVWPPKVGEPFPDIVFTNYDGRKIRMSDFAGKVVLAEPIGMTCPACNGFSGGQTRGGVGDIVPQQGLYSIEQYLPAFGGGVTLDNRNVVLVQIMLYDLYEDAPDMEDVRVWAEHFGFDRNPNVYVVFSEHDLRGLASYLMIPGFHLVDRQSVVRYDATGHWPEHDLYTELLPAVPQLLRN